ncbi:hypothetical protein [Streptomyces sp. TLI_171]|uniref:hypothetical protein n=1 Tax=Streptomyces sp. TLI_171 TaxID=1938859 RepID=UPI00217E3FD3|nr:hypothetical protein [Streptomyces sp. TLI_171]
MIVAEVDTEKSNELITAGRMPEVMGRLLETLKPEAAYFHSVGGRRGFTLVADLDQESALVPAIEPLWLELGATVTVTPCMNAEELRAGIDRLTS